jgi:putative toxin-antitoxin system antitoxin component (TIGR02293 family)
MAAELNPVLADVPAMSPELRKVYDVLRELLGEQAPPEGEHDLVVGAFAGFKPLSVHRLAMKGVQKHLARKFSSAFLLLPRKEVLRVIGVSERTLQRAEDDDVLDPNASDRLLRLAAVIEQAIEVLRSQEAAEAWLERPAIALDRNRPMDLLETFEGTELVKTLLQRMDYEIYF